MTRYFSLPCDYNKLFSARFLERPNRFRVVCNPLEGGPRFDAFLPNPGRLSELLYPGSTVIVLENPGKSETRTTKFTVVAVMRDGSPVMLHTHWCNNMAEALLNQGLVPGLEGVRILRKEVTIGHSRFDFLVEDSEGLVYLEVKSCTLFAHHVAMFPDAITNRGRRHLVELATLATASHRCGVLFIVQTDKARWFVPDYHTDLAFAQTMVQVRHDIAFHALPIHWKQPLRYRPGGPLLEIPWKQIEKEAQDTGAYILILHLDNDKVIEVGGLGKRVFTKGFYLYVGSAMRGLAARLAHHQRKRKRYHWHIDYLRDTAHLLQALPIRTSTKLECEIVASLNKKVPSFIEGFGASDCTCDSHLLFQEENPLDQSWFHHWLLDWRTLMIRNSASET